MKRHAQDSYYVVGEGELAFDQDGKPVVRSLSTASEIRRFRFSRLGPRGVPTSSALNQILAQAMTAGTSPDSGSDGGEPVQAGFTYLGQFVDHDLTGDRTAVDLGADVSVAELVQSRSPSLDLDSLYGRGPRHSDDKRFYAPDGMSLRTGTTAAVPIDAGTNTNRDGFDLPRAGVGETKAAERAPLIPDVRNDENLAVAQLHIAFMHFHNRTVSRLSSSVPSALLFDRARAEVVRHYQWMLRHDYLPKIVEPAIVDEVFSNGRRFFEPDDHDTSPTMPIEFSIAAFRLGHSMVRGAYQWNRVFNSTPPVPGGPVRLGIATLVQLFTFTGTSGNMTPLPTLPPPPPNVPDLRPLDDPNSGSFLRLPTNWIVDWRRLFDFSTFGPGFAAPADSGGGNITKRIDTLLVNPLALLPAGSFGGREQELAPDDVQRNLAFRNLTRANMVELASGQQMAKLLEVPEDHILTQEQILKGSGDGVDLTATGTLGEELRQELLSATPLWFYILREAELNRGQLGHVGGRIVAEVFHRAMEGSQHSIVREPDWRPTLGTRGDTFEMIDLIMVASESRLDKLNPLGDV
jgi:hypothetical protein